jgi:hypothetical protein
VWGGAGGGAAAARPGCEALLQFLGRSEVERLRAWAHPISTADTGAAGGRTRLLPAPLPACAAACSC